MKTRRLKRRYPSFVLLCKARDLYFALKRKRENEQRFVEETLRRIRECDRLEAEGKVKPISFEKFCEWSGLND